MKKTGFIILLILSLNIVCVTHAQNNKKFFFDEVDVSVNRTFLNDNNTTNKYGFGIGIFHSWFYPKKFNLTFGFEYNKTNQKKDCISAGRFSHYEDITYTINTISFPLLIRINFGKNIRLFFETGASLDIVCNVKRKGKMITCYPNENNILEYEEKNIDNKATGFASTDFGLIGGIGIKIPVKKVEIIFKTDYHYGLKYLYYYQSDVYNNYGRIVIGLKYNYSNKERKTNQGKRKNNETFL